MSSVLIRQAVARGESSTFHDIEVNASVITIGSGSKNIIALDGSDVRARHAVIEIGQGGAWIRAPGRHKIDVDGISVSSIEAAPGYSLAIGNATVLVLPTPPGFDLALQVAGVEADSEQYLESSYRTELQQTGLRKRGPAWALAILVFGLFLVAPLVATKYTAQGEHDLPAVIGDALWSSGPVHKAHRLATDNDCTLCHQSAFSRVPDQACTECHEEVTGHASPHAMKEHGLSNQICVDCHREHDGPGTLVNNSGADCRSCHIVAGLEAGHPAFSNYPTPELTTILFDHTSHQREHFGETERGFVCGDCHSPDESGRHQKIGSFESMCVNCHGASDTSRASTVFHHGDQIASADPVTFFNLPRIDSKTLKDIQGMGAWPDGTQKGTRKGLTRLGISPFIGLLLSTEAEAAPALERLRQGKTKLSSLKSASEADIADVLTILWAVKRLVAELEADIPGTLANRLEPALGRSLSRRELAALSGQATQAFMAGVVATWFPGDKWPALVEELKNLQGAIPVPSLPPGSEKVTSLPGATWVRTGQWSEQKFAMQYQLAGHADDFIRGWLEICFSLMQKPDKSTSIENAVRSSAKELYDILADSKASPGAAKGVGRCSKCHSQGGAGSSRRMLIWSAASPEPAGPTQFDHAQHTGAENKEVCGDCHMLNENADYLSAHALDAEPESIASNFSPITVEVCGTCHAPQQQASSECMSCHNYHVLPISRNPLEAPPGKEHAN
jgi:hypothetical protein